MSVTIQSLNGLGHEIKILRERKELLKKELGELESNIKELELQFIQYLSDNGLERYYIPDFGTAYVSRRFTYKVPKEPGDREEFFGYLKAKGIFDEMITVHSQTLNSWAKKELDVAIDEGASDFKIPGLGDPVLFETLGVRKS